LKDIKKILIIIQRSNGDVFLSQKLISVLCEQYQSISVDLLVNNDTLPVAKLLSNICFIHTFSYKKKCKNPWQQEKDIISSIFRKYDLSINLTASDRSVLYAIIAGKISISAIEKDNKKSWWKKLLLTHHYFFDSTQHILLNNLEPLKFLKIIPTKTLGKLKVSETAISHVRNKLYKKGIKDFVIFHPSAQYNYKIYPKHLRNKLLAQLNDLDIGVIITGGKSQIDTAIKKQLPVFSNVFDLIGDTSIEEYCALSKLSLAYIGMDTLNMHIAAVQNKQIFAIFGPTNLRMWSPWSNELKTSATKNAPMQTYGKITLFQANMPCVACGNAGCNNNHGKSDCLDHINPEIISESVKKWYQNVRL
jgi:heptosyltransferase III